MNTIIFGGTGMVGQGVLRECLLDPDVLHVLSVVRSPSGQRHPKLRELEHENFFDFSAIESELAAAFAKYADVISNTEFLDIREPWLY